MKKCNYTSIKTLTSSLLSPSASAALFAQIPEVIVDLNQRGRPLAEVNEAGYNSWFNKSGQAGSKIINGNGQLFVSMADNDANAGIPVYDATGKKLLRKTINNNSME